jgi:hypothetical protein
VAGDAGVMNSQHCFPGDDLRRCLAVNSGYGSPDQAVHAKGMA